jgi:high-affinity Fe2+/Pb2+ permease
MKTSLLIGFSAFAGAVLGFWLLSLLLRITFVLASLIMFAIVFGAVAAVFSLIIRRHAKKE